MLVGKGCQRFGYISGVTIVEELFGGEICCVDKLALTKFLFFLFIIDTIFQSNLYFYRYSSIIRVINQ